MSVYRERRRKRRHGASHFALIPFIDMMTILVVFLLAHTADVDILPNSKNISIPQSLSDRKPSAAVVVMVTKDSVLVDGKLVASLADFSASVDPVFAPLKAALVAQNALASSGAQPSETDVAKREVTIMGDKDTPYSVLKKIMLTCSDAEYGKVSFAVVERERAAT
jgi:biopolymer transport protein ExbD